jgi:hypothetical protein
MITLPLQSIITLRKDGSRKVEHTAFVTGEVGQAFAEAVVELKGGSIEEIVRSVDEKEAVNA